MTTYQSLITVDVHAPQIQRASEIANGLEYVVVTLIEEYRWSLDAVTDALDNARQAAEDQWASLHPSEDS